QDSTSSSLEALIQSRYPDNFAKAPIKTASPPKDKHSPEYKEPPKDLEVEGGKSSMRLLKALKNGNVFRPGTRPTTSHRQVPEAVVSDKNGTSEEDTLPATLLTPTPSARGERDAKLADMLGVTVDKAKPATLPTTMGRSGMPQSDEQIVEEISRQGVVLPISPHDIPALSFEDRVMDRPGTVAVVETRASKQALAQRPRPRPSVPNVRVTTESRHVKRPSPKRESPSKATSSTATSMFVPKKAREQQKGKVAVKKPEPPQRTAKASSGSRQLLKPPDHGKHSSTDESDPEVSTFKRLAQSGSHPSTLARRRERRPERQLSSISEKSAEIAAEAALQNQPQDYSISAPNTTRSLSEWHHYVHKKTSGEDASESQTDVDIPSGKKFRSTASKSRAAIERLKKKRTEPFALWKPRQKADVSTPPRRRRLCEPSSSDTSSKASSTKRKPVRSRSPLVRSPDIPDVTLRRSMDRLDQIERSSPQGALTSRSHIRRRASSKKPYEGSGKDYAVRPISSKDESFFSRSKWEKSADADSVRKPARKISIDADMPTSSRNSHHHALISRKIAIRRHEMYITKSTSDLTDEPHSSRHFSRTRQTSHSADNLYRHSPWDSSSHRQDDHLHTEPFLPGIRSTTRPHRKSHSVLNSPRGSFHRTMSKFSLMSLPIRSSSTLELSPYFTPGENSNKPPKENLWWTPGSPSFR
ncbi:hypothetical protein OSTOST_01276, partial [Ostertagia ostertagi]